MIFSSFSIQGETFNLSCRDFEDLIISFKVDVNEKKITHTTSSVSPNSSSSNKGEIFEVFKDENVIRWSYPNVWTSRESEYSDNYGFRYFDFVNDKMRYTTLEDIKKIGIEEDYPKYFDCFRT